MAKQGMITLLLLSAVLVADVRGDAAATPTTICSVSVSELVECLPAITGKSPKWPSKGCCSVMRKADMNCLCKYKSDFSKFGVDPAKAMALPEKCAIKLPRACKQ
ncbi:hypothetical protein ACJIZ3_013043 [Penstemon smallii]|uniref:Bifunctional inhibitor/plant lipid transfer protein/seed storage helical domain-containing protein n=1 Tax=Penstemon smallii TaxID=265156 RepID=A0ABD3UQV7_9LAMI